MDLTRLVTTIVSGIVTNKDDIKIEEFTSEDEITIEVLVKEEDMGRLIGKHGKTINAIRTLCQASNCMNNNNKYVKINADKF